MNNLKLATIFVLLFTVIVCSAANMTEKLLPTARFGGWFTIRDESSENHINQIWRTTLSSPVRGVQGYVVVSYRAEECISDNISSSKISDFISRRRFTDYIAKGYEVLSAPWNTPDGFGAIFNISGVTRSDKDTYNRARIYAIGLTRNNYSITLEVRLSVSGENTDDIKKCIDKNDISVLSNELAKFILPIWQIQTIKTPDEPIRTPMAQDPPKIPVIPEIIELSPNEIEVEPEIIIDPTPSSIDNTIKPAALDNVNRWFTIDHHLSMVIAPTWKYTGTDKQSTWVNTSAASIRIYNAEKYDTNADLAAAIDDFAVAQKAIFLHKFEQTPLVVDDADGVLVRYTNYSKNTTQSYLFGKSGRIWRIDIYLPGENAPLPDEIKTMILSVKAD